MNNTKPMLNMYTVTNTSKLLLIYMDIGKKSKPSFKSDSDKSLMILANGARAKRLINDAIKKIMNHTGELSKNALVTKLPSHKIMNHTIIAGSSTDDKFKEYASDFSAASVPSTPGVDAKLSWKVLYMNIDIPAVIRVTIKNINKTYVSPNDEPFLFCCRMDFMVSLISFAPV